MYRFQISCEETFNAKAQGRRGGEEAEECGFFAIEMPSANRILQVALDPDLSVSSLIH